MRTEIFFEKYGRSTKLITEKNVTTVLEYKSFLQPLRYKNKLYLRGKYTEIGKNGEDYYLYIGPAEYDISAVDAFNVRLVIGETDYVVYRTEKHYIGDEVIYIWAIVRPVIADTGDGSDEGGGGAVG